MTSPPALAVDNLHKTYSNGVEALKGVSLNVQQGDFFALLGPNGAGKSTLIGILSSLVSATSGDARIFGVSVQQQRSAAMRLIGLVPQEVNFNQFEKPFDICVNEAGFYGIPRKIDARGRCRDSVQTGRRPRRRGVIARVHGQLAGVGREIPGWDGAS